MCDWLRIHATEIAECQPEAALECIIEWFECDLIEDPDTTTITLRGSTAHVRPEVYGWQSDPLYEDGNDRIVKKCAIADLQRTIARWRKMARCIDRVSVH